MIASLTGCVTTEQRAISAARATGEARARTELPAYPARCREHMGRVTPSKTEKHTWTQKRWEFSADAVDRQIDDCSAFYDGVREDVAKETTQ